MFNQEMTPTRKIRDIGGEYIWAAKILLKAFSVSGLKAKKESKKTSMKIVGTHIYENVAREQWRKFREDCEKLVDDPTAFQHFVSLVNQAHESLGAKRVSEEAIRKYVLKAADDFEIYAFLTRASQLLDDV